MTTMEQSVASKQIPVTTPHHEETAPAGLDLGQLDQLAKKIFEIEKKRTLLERLLLQEVGTKKIEIEAWRLASDERMGRGEIENTKSKKTGSKWSRVLKERDPDKVEDVLSLKVKYCREDESVRGAQVEVRQVG